MKKMIKKFTAILLSILFTVNILPVGAFAAELAPSKSTYTKIDNVAVWFDEDDGEYYVIMAYDDSDDVIVSKSYKKNGEVFAYEATLKNTQFRSNKYSESFWTNLKNEAIDKGAFELKLVKPANEVLINNMTRSTGQSLVNTKMQQAYGTPYHNLIKTDTASYPGTTIKIWEQYICESRPYDYIDVVVGLAVSTAVSMFLAVIQPSDGYGVGDSFLSVIIDLCSAIINDRQQFTAGARLYPFLCTATRTRYGTVNSLSITFAETFFDINCTGLYWSNNNSAKINEVSRVYSPTEYTYNSPNHVWLIRETYNAYNNYIN